jgi:hypothetical protein
MDAEQELLTYGITCHRICNNTHGIHSDHDLPLSVDAGHVCRCGVGNDVFKDGETNEKGADDAHSHVIVSTSIMAFWWLESELIFQRHLQVVGARPLLLQNRMLVSQLAAFAYLHHPHGPLLMLRPTAVTTKALLLNGMLATKDFSDRLQRVMPTACGIWGWGMKRLKGIQAEHLTRVALSPARCQLHLNAQSTRWPGSHGSERRLQAGMPLGTVLCSQWCVGVMLAHPCTDPAVAQVQPHTSHFRS